MNTVHLISLGCARNRVDSEEMLARLAAAGWVVTDDPGQARAIVVNTCGFVQSAVEESIDVILQMGAHRRAGRCRRLVVVGCLPERFREKLQASLPEVDAFLGTGAFDRIVDALQGPAMIDSCLLPDPDCVVPATSQTERLLSTAPWAYLKIAEGCSRRCTYCIIPRLRGRQRSRPQAALIEEARSLIGTGARELVLVAQDTTAYGNDGPEFGNLAALLADLAGLDPGVWIRFLYGHPESITPAVWETVARTDNICSYFDIPVQHASERILRRMGRDSTPGRLLKLYERIRTDVPGAALRTTVIVGFPGETEQDFGQLEDFIETVAFDHLGVFVYSDFDDLPSHRLAGHVPADLACRRRDRLLRRQKKISRRNNHRHLGRELQVLIQERGSDGRTIARSTLQAPEVDGLTYIDGDCPMPGTFGRVRVTAARAYDLEGTCL